MASRNLCVSARIATPRTSRPCLGAPGASEGPPCQICICRRPQTAGDSGRSRAAERLHSPMTPLQWLRGLGGRTPHSWQQHFTHGSSPCPTLAWPGLRWARCRLTRSLGPCPAPGEPRAVCPPAGNVLRGGFFSGELWLLLGPGQSLPRPGPRRHKQPSHDGGCRGAVPGAGPRPWGPAAPPPPHRSMLING